MRKAGLKRMIAVGAIFSTALIVGVLIAVSLGPAQIAVRDCYSILMSEVPIIRHLVSTDNILPSHIMIVRDVRLPRVLLAGLVGAALAVAGAVLQGVLKNPLADPQVLGISSGAAFGAAIAITFGLSYSGLGIGGIGGAAFIGAMVSIFIVWRISFYGGRSSVMGILLAGIAYSSLLTAAITMIMIFDREKLEMVYLWMLGSFSAANDTRVVFMFLFLLPALLLILPFSSALDILTTGDESAESMGVHTEAVRKTMIVAASFLVAASVSVSGIIGFVGLIIPHIVRLIVGPKHSRLIPISCVVGALFMIICDTIARTLLPPTEIPVGAITAVLGAPFFLFLLWRSRTKGVLR